VVNIQFIRSVYPFGNTTEHMTAYISDPRLGSFK